VPLTKTLNLNVAVRDDHFSDFGNTVNPKAASATNDQAA
jgi:iron complex outermembrane receptor protein